MKTRIEFIRSEYPLLQKVDFFVDTPNRFATVEQHQKGDKIILEFPTLCEYIEKHFGVSKTIYKEDGSFDYHVYYLESFTVVEHAEYEYDYVRLSFGDNYKSSFRKLKIKKLLLDI